MCYQLAVKVQILFPLLFYLWLLLRYRKSLPFCVTGTKVERVKCKFHFQQIIKALDIQYQTWTHNSFICCETLNSNTLNKLSKYAGGDYCT